MERNEKLEIAEQAVTHGLQGGLVSAAASIVSGAAIGSAMTTTPVTILWGLITIGTTTVTTPIWLPTVIAGAAVGGAVLAGTAGAAVAYRRVQKFNDDWAAACNGDTDG